jgi:hypothetical protein
MTTENEELTKEENMRSERKLAPAPENSGLRPEKGAVKSDGPEADWQHPLPLTRRFIAGRQIYSRWS